MKTSTNCMAAIKTANSMLGVGGKETENKIADIQILLSNSMVQLHLE